MELLKEFLLLKVNPTVPESYCFINPRAGVGLGRAGTTFSDTHSSGKTTSSQRIFFGIITFFWETFVKKTVVCPCSLGTKTFEQEEFIILYCILYCKATAIDPGFISKPWSFKQSMMFASARLIN